jgi:drug/metabolite transporter (DMT)-like permease
VTRARRLQADLALLAVCAIWGATFVVVQNALADASPLVFLSLRFGIASVLLWLLFGRRRAARAPRAARAGLLLGVFLCAGYIFQTVGLLYTTPTKSAFITSLASVLVPLLLVVVFRRHPGGWALAGLGVAVVGCYFLTMPSGTFSISRGDAITFLCAVSFAAHIVATGRYAPNFRFETLAMYQVTAALALTALSVPLAAATGFEAARLAMTGRLLVALVMTAALATVVAFTVQTWAQQFTPPAHTALIFTTEPVFAALTSYLAIGEHLSGRGWLGAGLILSGVLLSEILGRAPSALPGSAAANPGEGNCV